MVRMSSERDAVISIRHQVNQYVQLGLAQAGTSADPSDPTTGTGDTQPLHVFLGSWENYRDVGGYEEEVLKDFGFTDFAQKLATFLQRFGFDVHGNDFNPDAGHRIHIKRMRVGM